MKLSASHLTRYRQIAALLGKHGRSDLAKQMGEAEGFDVGSSPPTAGRPAADTTAAAGARGLPAQLADDLESMGPTYVKRWQVLAGRPDLLPDAYLEALARLQDK